MTLALLAGKLIFEELVNYFLDFSKYVEEIGNFINKADEVTEKN